MTILFGLLFILLILVFARQAFQDGVLVQYWGILGLIGGLGSGGLFFHFLINIWELLFPDSSLPVGLNVVVSCAVGLVVYFIARAIAKHFLNKWFGLNSALTDWTDEWRGAFLSLLPSIITILILVSGLRLGGTLMELRHLEYICRPRVSFSTSQYPDWPIWVKWRNSVEGVPFLAEGLESMDPISRLPERRIVCLLLASKKPELLYYLQSEPETASIFESSAMREVMISEDIKTLLNQFQYVTLIKHPLVHQAAHDPEVVKPLADLELRRVIDGFMLLPERQEQLKNERI